MNVEWKKELLFIPRSSFRVHHFPFLPSFGNFASGQAVFVPTLTTLALEAFVQKRIVFRQADECLSIALCVGATSFDLDEQHFAWNNYFSHRFKLTALV